MKKITKTQRARIEKMSNRLSTRIERDQKKQRAITKKISRMINDGLLSQIANRQKINRLYNESGELARAISGRIMCWRALNQLTRDKRRQGKWERAEWDAGYAQKWLEKAANITR